MKIPQREKTSDRVSEGEHCTFVELPVLRSVWNVGLTRKEDQDQSIWLFIVMSLVSFEVSRLHPLCSRESLEHSKQAQNRAEFVVYKTDHPGGASMEDGWQREQDLKCESGEVQLGEGPNPWGGVMEMSQVQEMLK